MNLISFKGRRIIFLFSIVISFLFAGIFPLKSFATLEIDSTGGGFENGSTLAANGWTAVNNISSTANNWYVGTGGGSSGSNFAFISNTVGSSYNYDNTTASIVHFYQSVTVPSGETNIQLSFQLRSVGELNTDEMIVYTGTGALSAGSLPGGGYTAVFTQNSTTTWAGYATVHVQLPAALAGTTFNLVFTWQNNSSGGSEPPASVDYISLTSASCIISSFPWTEGFESMTSFGSGVVPYCWATQDVYGPNWVSANTSERSGVGAHSGNNFLYATYNGDAWAYTPGMQLNGGTTYYFSFYYALTDAISGFTLTAAVGTSQSSSSMTTIGTLTNPLNTSYTLAYFAYTPSTSGVYYFGINSTCSDPPWYLNIDDIGVSTTSPCTITTLPWTEGFETTTPGSGNTPPCWATQVIANPNWICASSVVRNVGAHSGSHYMYATYNGNAWLYTPGIALTGGSTYYFSYFYALTDAVAGFTITTGVGTSQNSSSMTTLGTMTPISTSWQQAVYSYTPSTTGVYYFGINSDCTDPPYYFNIDDIELQSAACLPPTPTGATIAGSNSDTATWTCAGCTGSYVVEYGPTATFTAPGTGATAGPNGTVIDVPANTYSTLISGLTSGTEYTYYVRQNCGSGVYSVNYGSDNFSPSYCTTYLYSTGCNDGDELVNFNLSNLSHTNSGCSGSTSNQAGTGFGDFTSSEPTINLVRGLSYSWSASTCCDLNSIYLKMWIDYNNDGVFETSEQLLATPYGPITVNNPTTFGGTILIPSTVNPGNFRLRVRIVYQQSNFDACTQYQYGEVQDYTCSITAPSCPIPTSAAASNVTLTTAQANWTCSGGCSGNYIVEYGPSATFTTPGTGATAGTNGTVIDVSSASLDTIISGLAEGTQYTYYVREDCSGGGGGYSDNSSPQTFTTLIPLSIGTIVANQQTGTTTVGASNANIWRLDIPATGSLGTQTLNSIRFTSENTSDADIAASGVKLWTGTTTAPSTVIGTTQTFASGSVTFSGLNLNIQAGTTYLWLTYTISGSATVGDVVDAYINAGDIGLTASGGAASAGSEPPALLDPAGNVLIDYCDNYLYTTGCNDNDALISFTISNLSHLNSGCSGNVSNLANSGYGNFTSSEPTINFVQGATYSWTASINYNGNHWLQMWIDLNNDGVFESSEALLSVPFPQPGVSDPGTFGSSFTLSSSAATGTHRFRVREVYATSSFDACTQYQYGEVQDYTCSITAPNCQVPTSTAVTNINFTSAQANWTCTGCTGAYIVEFGPTATFTTPGTGNTAGANGTIINISAASLDTIISGLASATQYTYYVRGDCSASGNGYSDNSAPQYFTTLGTIIANQETGVYPLGTTGVNILRLDMPITGNIVTLVLNSINFTSKNTNDADVSSGGVKLWTGSTSGPTTQIGTAQTFSSGAATFSGLNLSLTTGTTYYFWLTYDISPTATLLDSLDAKINVGDISFTAGGTGYTEPLSLLDPAGGVQINYCEENLYSSGCTHGDDITSFAVSNLNNTTSGCSVSINGDGYSDFTTSQPVINFTQGGTYTWTATDNYSYGHYLQMWIDYNNNGFLESGEALLSVPLPQPSTGGPINVPFGSSFTIPTSAATGNHRFRVRIVWQTASFGACDAEYEGEAEDYTCTIVAPDCPVPVSTAATSVGLTSAQTNWTCSGCTGAYIVEYGTTATFTPGTGNTAGANGTILNVSAGSLDTTISGLANDTSYTYYVREDCSGSGNGYSVNSAPQSFTTLIPLTLGTIVANQQTGYTSVSSSNVNILRVDLPASGTLGTLTLNSVTFTSENTNDADITAGGVKLWTGTTSAPVTQIGTAQTFSSGAVTFSGLNLNLVNASANSLWLTYNIASAATIGDSVDAKISAGNINITAPGGAANPGMQPPSLLDPAGNLLIDYCDNNLYSSGCTHGDDITSFSLSTGNDTILYNPTSGCSVSINGDGYSNFTSSQPVINFIQGGTYTWSAENNYGGGHYLQMWIDYNNDGVFEAGEALLSVPYPQPNAGNNTPFGSSFTIPFSVPAGMHRFRVRLVWSTSSFGACDALYEGDVEDYTCNVQTIPMEYISSTTTPNNTDVQSNTVNQVMVGLQVVTLGGLSPLSVSSINFNTASTSNPTTDITNARIYYTGTSSTFAATGQFGSTVAAPGGSYTVSGSQALVQGTNYFWLTYDIPAGATINDLAEAAVTSYVLSGTSETPANTSTAVRQIDFYCIPAAYTDCNSSPDGGISKVQLNTINNSSGCAPSGDYSNYTISPSSSQTTTLIAGQDYTIIIDRGGSTTAAYTVKVWIDFNQDGTLANSSPELIYSFTSTNPSGFSGSFNVPSNAVAGATRMRVRMAQDVDDACDNPTGGTNYGETEDYTVTIQSPCTVAGVPSATAAADSVCFDGTTSITASNITGTNAVLHWWGGSSGTGTDYGTSNPLTGVGAGTYYARVTADCGSAQEQSATVTQGTCHFNYTVKLFLQGYYLGGNQMSPLLHLLGAASATAVDTVTVEFHNSNATSIAAYSYKSVLQTNGDVQLSVDSSALIGSYWIVIKHRNSIETWSSGTQGLSIGRSYDFSTGANKAYGSMVNLDGTSYGIYSGDVNRDGTIDESDKTSIRAVLSLFKIGVYNVNDINGDGFVDEDDFRMVENNIQLSISVSHP